MFCTRCQNELIDCECEDIEDRLERLANINSVVSQWCETCDSHHSRCECDNAEWVIR